MSRVHGNLAERIAPTVVEMLAGGPCSKGELARRTGRSEMTIQRSLTWLRNTGVPISFSRSTMLWSLEPPGQSDEETAAREAVFELVRLRAITKGEGIILAGKARRAAIHG